MLRPLDLLVGYLLEYLLLRLDDLRLAYLVSEVSQVLRVLWTEGLLLRSHLLKLLSLLGDLIDLELVDLTNLSLLLRGLLFKPLLVSLGFDLELLVKGCLRLDFFLLPLILCDDGLLHDHDLGRLALEPPREQWLAHHEGIASLFLFEAFLSQKLRLLKGLLGHRRLRNSQVFHKLIKLALLRHSLVYSF